MRLWERVFREQIKYEAARQRGGGNSDLSRHSPPTDTAARATTAAHRRAGAGGMRAGKWGCSGSDGAGRGGRVGSQRSLVLVGSAATVGAQGGAAPAPGVTYPEEGYDPIPGDGLQEAGGSSETLQPSPTCGEERANDNDPRGRPRQGANHQVPIDGLTKPAGHQHHLQFHPMTEPQKHQHHSGTTQPPTTTLLWGVVTQQGNGPTPRGVSSGAGSEVARGLSSSLYPLAWPRGGVGRDSSSLCRGGSDDAFSWILFVLVLATQKCHLPRAVSRAAPDRKSTGSPAC